MSAKKRPKNGSPRQPATRTDTPDQAGRSAEACGPQSPGPWGWGGGADRPSPWGVSEDSPMDEGSEPTAVPEGRRGERRAAPSGRPGRHGLGSVEPTRVPEAGPGGAPDAAPGRRPFPDGSSTCDVPDNALERQTGMPTKGRTR